MNIAEFNKPNLSNMTWAQIFNMYNDNFDRVQAILMSLGSNFVVEEFTNTTNPVVTLATTYTPNQNQLMVFLSGAIQTKGSGYTETAVNTVTLSENPELTDKIKVIICKSFSLVEEITPYLVQVQQLHTEITTMYNEILTMYNELITP